MRLELELVLGRVSLDWNPVHLVEGQQRTKGVRENKEGRERERCLEAARKGWKWLGVFFLFLLAFSLVASSVPFEGRASLFLILKSGHELGQGLLDFLAV